MPFRRLGTISSGFALKFAAMSMLVTNMEVESVWRLDRHTVLDHSIPPRHPSVGILYLWRVVDSGDPQTMNTRCDRFRERLCLGRHDCRCRNCANLRDRKYNINIHDIHDYSKRLWMTSFREQSHRRWGG